MYCIKTRKLPKIERCFFVQLFRKSKFFFCNKKFNFFQHGLNRKLQKFEVFFIYITNCSDPCLRILLVRITQRRVWFIYTFNLLIPWNYSLNFTIEMPLEQIVFFGKNSTQKLFFLCIWNTFVIVRKFQKTLLVLIYHEIQTLFSP